MSSHLSKELSAAPRVVIACDDDENSSVPSGQQQQRHAKENSIAEFNIADEEAVDEGGVHTDAGAIADSDILSTLPCLVKQRICFFLASESDHPRSDLNSLASVSRTWRQVAGSNQFWKPLCPELSFLSVDRNYRLIYCQMQNAKVEAKHRQEMRDADTERRRRVQERHGLASPRSTATTPTMMRLLPARQHQAQAQRPAQRRHGLQVHQDLNGVHPEGENAPGHVDEAPRRLPLGALNNMASPVASRQQKENVKVKIMHVTEGEENGTPILPGFSTPSTRPRNLQAGLGSTPYLVTPVSTAAARKRAQATKTPSALSAKKSKPAAGSRSATRRTTAKKHKTLSRL